MLKGLIIVLLQYPCLPGQYSRFLHQINSRCDVTCPSSFNHSIWALPEVELLLDYLCQLLTSLHASFQSYRFLGGEKCLVRAVTLGKIKSTWTDIYPNHFLRSVKL
jgi:hypothetical protein